MLFRVKLYRYTCSKKNLNPLSIDRGFFLINLWQKKARFNAAGFLVLPPGLEPGTCGLTVRRSKLWENLHAIIRRF